MQDNKKFASLTRQNEERGDMISVYKYVKLQNSQEREQLFKLKEMLAQEQMDINWLRIN